MNLPLATTIACVLFDLDGTLLDSAPDLYAALQAQCAEENVAAPAFGATSPVMVTVASQASSTEAQCSAPTPAKSAAP